MQLSPPAGFGFLPLLTALVGVFLSALPAQARLGETREECAVRYGPAIAEVAPLLESANCAVFMKGEIRVRIEFLNNKASYLSFSRPGLRQEDRQVILEANAGPMVWSPPAEFLGRLCWTAPANAKEPARHAAAYSATDNNYLDIATDEWAKAMKAQQAIQFAVQPQALPASSTRTPGSSPAATPGSGAGADSPQKGKLDGF
ncbi:MAG: hypothetical protein JWL81_1061 [Verrucomicrobiales bacterium]|nr:hypothetical protein [Verrucomicrobiales bacterium]